MKRLFALFLVMVALMPIHSLAETFSVTFEDGEMKVSFVHVDEEVEDKLDQYIAEFGLSEECKDVIIEHLPDVNQFDRMEREGLVAFSIFMQDGTKYYLSVMKDMTPTCLQSSEKDHKSRTRYYDKFAK